MKSNQDSTAERPTWLQHLEEAFGGPSQAAFGTAVFFDRIPDGDGVVKEALEKRARECYQHFCGKAWAALGPDNWLRTWGNVYSRRANNHSILDALTEMEDPAAKSGASMMLECSENPQAARTALKQAFDDPTIQQLLVFRIGDGGVMSGILIAGRRQNGEAAFVLFLLD